MRLNMAIGIGGLLIFFCVSCQSEPPSTPYPTYTLYPTYTPYPTNTPFLSSKPLPSDDIEGLVWPTGPRDDVIPFADAADFIGEQVTVEGTVIQTHNSGSVVFLNFSPEIDTFTAVIFPDDWSKFPAPPEDLFYGKLVRVEGIIEEYQGKPEIIIKDPWQIEVALTLGQPIVAATCQCPPTQAAATPTVIPESTVSTTLTSESEGATSPPVKTKSISWQQAADYVGQTITIQGQVVGSYNSGKVVFLNFDQDYRNTFKAVIFAEAWPLFPGPPEDYYLDKIVRVTGQVKIYQNAPEIIIENLEQIEIME